MLDNDLIRLQQKVSVVLQMKEEEKHANKHKSKSDKNTDA
jgi:hypothetical protein